MPEEHFDRLRNVKKQPFISRVMNVPERAFTTLLQSIGYLARPVSALRHRSRDTVLIKHGGGIGDYVLLTASFPGYRALYPDARIVLIVRQEVRDLARFNPYIDRCITVDFAAYPRNPFARLRLWAAIVMEHVDIAINVDYSSHYEALDRAVMQWSMASRKIAFACLDKDAHRDTGIYSDVVQQSEEWMFEIDRNNRLLRYLGLASYDNRTTMIWNLETYTPPAGLLDFIPRTPYYVICPGSLRAEKCWPADRFASLIDELSYLGCTALICGSARESGTARAIQERASAVTIDLTGKTQLMDLCFIIRGARLMLSNDSAAAHIAAAVRTQGFAILGGGHYGRFLPYPGEETITPIINEEYRVCFNCYWQCLYDTFRCIQETSVQQVADSIRRVFPHHAR
jgi:ADP-heptose:LPS heptosyltransferase